jgi:FkbM family methyltransferase
MIKYALRNFFFNISRGLLPLSMLPSVVTDTCLNGLKLSMVLRTEIGKRLYFHGDFEQDEITLIGKLIRSDFVILDIGANIGYNILCFAQYAPDGQLYAFEPDKDTFRLLVKNINQNKLFHIKASQTALSDQKGTGNFYVCSDNAYSSLKDTKRKKIVKTVPVNVTTLDDFITENTIKRIDLIKIDVEGFEYNVLNGGSKAIKQFRPLIVCEIYKGTDSNSDPDGTVSSLINQGYSAWVFHGDGLVPHQRHDDNYYNYLFVPSEKKDLLSYVPVIS